MDLVERVAATPLFRLGGTEFTLAKMGALLGLLGLLYAGTRWIERLVTARLRRAGQLDPGALVSMSRLWRYAALTVGTLVIFQTVGVDLSAVVVLAGTLGIGIGLALQPILSNFVGGLVLLIDRSIKVGDRVEVGGLLGDVLRISSRATTIVTNDNIAVIVPNAEMISTRIVNWSHTDRRVRYRIPVGVSYASDPDQIRSVLFELANAHPGVLREPPPDVVLDSFGDSALLFELRVWTEDYTRLPSVFRSELNHVILRAFRAHGIEIPFPQRVLHTARGPGKGEPT